MLQSLLQPYVKACESGEAVCQSGCPAITKRSTVVAVPALITCCCAVTQACDVSDFTFGTTAANNLAGVYKMSIPAGCQLAVCARFPTQVNPFSLPLPSLKRFLNS